jgi:catechol 2,3-dioxygenase
MSGIRPEGPREAPQGEPHGEHPGEPSDSTRLPPATRPGPVRLQVADLSRSLAWYGEVLGLQLLDSGSGWARLGAPGEAPRAARVVASGTPHGTPRDTPPDGPGGPGGPHLVELVEQPGAAPVPRGGQLGLYHVAILLPERASLGRFVAHLAHLRIPAGSADHLVSEALYLNDPDGLGFEVYADRPPTSWARTPTGEIAMASNPLALDDLVRSGGEAPWTGLPSGTRVGHLHLHVGNLAAAEAFYSDALGLDVQVRSYPGALFLSAGGYHHHLGVNTWARGAAAPGPNDARLLSWSLGLPSPEAGEAALSRLEQAGHAVTRIEPAVGRVLDPWGTELRLGPDPGDPSEEDHRPSPTASEPRVHDVLDR